VSGTTSKSETTGFQGKVAFIWSVADLLRGDYKASEYGKVILPLVTLRRPDCVLAPTKAAVLERVKDLPSTDAVRGPVLSQITKHQGLYNTSPMNLRAVLDDSNNVAVNLRAYISARS
jgi:type I restriction enzyme M protein